LRINEIFHTIQGEGLTMGLPTVFVRTSGCNLRCTWCDTTYSFYEGDDTPLPEILDTVAKFGTKRVCLTGGEPLLQKDAPDLVQTLLGRSYQVTVETSGSLSVASLAALQPRRQLVLSVDVKCPSSAMEEENDWANLALLQPHDQLKFVIADEADYQFARRILEERPCRAEAIFQACWQAGATNLRWLAERVLRDGLDVRVGTQLHKHVWGDGPDAAPAAPAGSSHQPRAKVGEKP
jgi:7-carboxy-7-deazaguanine synthase